MFNKVDPAFVGKGEGGMGYGRAALYTGEQPSTAEGYARMLQARQPRQLTRNGERLAEDDASSLLRDLQAEQAEVYLRQLPVKQAIEKSYALRGALNSEVEQQRLSQLLKLQAQGIDSQPVPAYLYEIQGLPQEKFLNWQQPMSQQPPAIQGALSQFASDPNTPGFLIYKNAIKQTGSLDDASAALRERGVLGTIFRDRMNRNMGGTGNTMNRAVFSPEDISIVSRKELPTK
jgi:hypothetical protein